MKMQILNSLDKLKLDDGPLGPPVLRTFGWAVGFVVGGCCQGLFITRDSVERNLPSGAAQWNLTRKLPGSGAEENGSSIATMNSKQGIGI